ncbi:MAG: peptidase S51 [Planctomycetaceae bacterium]|nr:peptidase S51 [Planctomycetaceae bacterium]|tara:strand:- start:913 stop:1812 length:900 start_codon:yes stop_codon:yes gene_type:complete
MKHPPPDRILLIWVLLLGLTIPGMVAADDTEGPDRGTLLIAGGGGKQGAAIFRKFVELAGGNTARIVIVPTAISSDPNYDYQNPGVAKFARDRLKLKHVTVLHTHDRREADTREFVRPLKTANGVWFSGGRQWRFADSYLGTRSEKEFHRVLKRGGVIGGSSAGASIQADFLVRGDSRTNRIMIGDHQRGLGFIENCAIDQHVIKRGRQMGLVKVLTDPDGKMLRRFDREDLLGIGIDEDTAIIVRKNTFEVFGKPDAAVLIYDPRKWTAQTADAKKYITLKLGARYDMKKRRVLHLVP